MLVTFLALVSLLPSISLTERLQILPRTTDSVVSTGKPTFECFQHRDARTGHLDTASRSDCAKALKSIVAADKAKAPMVFSRSLAGGYHVPDQIESGTCVIHLNISDDSDSESKSVQMPMEQVVAAALHIMENCIKDEPSWTGLGGHALALSRSGSGGALEVAVFGQPPPPPPGPTLRMPLLYGPNSDTS